MKTALPWIIILILSLAVGALYMGNKAKETDLLKLDQQTQELTALRAEVEEFKKAPAQSDELARLRKDNEDLLRLRADVQRMREQTKQLNAQLATAQAQGVQAQQTQQQLSDLANENQALRTQAQTAQQAQQASLSPQAQQHLNSCLNNLRQLDGAKQQWALENKKSFNAVPSLADIAPYLINMNQLACPNGGAYTLNDMRTAPTCSVPGHVLR